MAGIRGSRMPKKNSAEYENWKGQAMRDWFAAYALMGMLASPPLVDRFTVDKRKWSRIAYEWADAMVRARG